MGTWGRRLRMAVGAGLAVAAMATVLVDSLGPPTGVLLVAGALVAGAYGQREPGRAAKRAMVAGTLAIPLGFVVLWMDFVGRTGGSSTQSLTGLAFVFALFLPAFLGVVAFYGLVASVGAVANRYLTDWLAG